MKNITLTFLLLINFNLAYAIDSTSNSTLNTNNTSTSNANSAIGTGSAIGNTTFNSTSSNPKQTPSAIGPSLTTSNDTCMGASSAGVGVPGISLAMGSTWTDSNCVRLKNSRELWNMGQHLASFAILCADTNNFTAIELANMADPTAPHCPQTVVALKNGRQLIMSPSGTISLTSEKIETLTSLLNSDKVIERTDFAAMQARGISAEPYISYLSK